jgi:hypothetical protein
VIFVETGHQLNVTKVMYLRRGGWGSGEGRLVCLRGQSPFRKETPYRSAGSAAPPKDEFFQQFCKTLAERRVFIEGSKSKDERRDLRESAIRKGIAAKARS